MRAEYLQGRVLVGVGLLGQFDGGDLGLQVLGAGGVAEGAPGGLAAGGAVLGDLAGPGDAAVGVEAGQGGQLAGAGLVGAGTAHGLVSLHYVIARSAATRQSRGGQDRVCGPWIATPQAARNDGVMGEAIRG